MDAEGLEFKEELKETPSHQVHTKRLQANTSLLPDSFILKSFQKAVGSNECLRDLFQHLAALLQGKMMPTGELWLRGKRSCFPQGRG